MASRKVETLPAFPKVYDPRLVRMQLQPHAASACLACPRATSACWGVRHRITKSSAYRTNTPSVLRWSSRSKACR